MGALSMISSCTEDEISSDYFLVIAQNQSAPHTLIASPEDGIQLYSFVIIWIYKLKMYIIYVFLESENTWDFLFLS